MFKENQKTFLCFYTFLNIQKSIIFELKKWLKEKYFNCGIYGYKSFFFNDIPNYFERNLILASPPYSRNKKKSVTMTNIKFALCNEAYFERYPSTLDIVYHFVQPKF